MSDTALFLGVAAMMCAAYALLGSFLEWVWGADPSRRTAGSMHGGGRIGFLMALHVIACAAYGGSAGTQMERLLGKTGALLIMVLVCAVVYPALGFSVLFASVRHDGEGLAAVAERLYGDAGKTVAQVLIVIASALLACTPSYSVVQLGLLQTLVLSQFMAPRIKNEKHIRIVAFSGSMAGGMTACFMLPDFEMPVWIREAFTGACLVCGIWSLCMMMNVGTHALLGLMRRNGLQKKKNIVQEILAIGCMLILWVTITYFSWQLDFPFTAIIGGMICLYALLLCIAWMKRIGRGLFSRY